MTIDSELTVLIDKALSKITELLCWLVSPPLHQVTKLVILPACNSQSLALLSHYWQHAAFTVNILRLNKVTMKLQYSNLAQLPVQTAISYTCSFNPVPISCYPMLLCCPHCQVSVPAPPRHTGQPHVPIQGGGPTAQSHLAPSQPM